jgi:hypothetical protein
MVSTVSDHEIVNCDGDGWVTFRAPSGMDTIVVTAFRREGSEDLINDLKKMDG